MDRGFERFVHTSNRTLAPILRSKLSSGFPHVEVRVPISALPAATLTLCRYNIARSRGIAAADGPFVGWRRDGFKVPIVSGAKECRDLLHHCGPDDPLELLFEGGLDLPTETEIATFHPEDLDVTSEIVARFKRPWRVILHHPLPQYARRQKWGSELAREI